MKEAARLTKAVESIQSKNAQGGPEVERHREAWHKMLKPFYMEINQVLLLARYPNLTKT